MKTLAPFRTLDYTVPLNVDDHLTIIKADSRVAKNAIQKFCN
jgi:hypothetical protein